MKKIIKYSRLVAVVAFATTLAVTAGCNRQKDSLGEDICPSSAVTVSLGDLTFNGMAADIVNLSAAGLNVVAHYDEKVKWTIKIEALDNSADKTFSGEGKDINIWWYGNSRKEPKFSPGACKLTFTVQCRDAVVKNFTLQGSSNFATLSSRYGALMRDWDKNGLLDIGTLATVQGAGVDGYFYGDDASKGVNWSYITTDGSPAGGYYSKADGFSKNINKLWYFGGVSIEGLSATNTSPLKALSTTNPDSIWLNAYIRSGTGLNTEAVISMGITAQVKWSYRKAINWDGWKMCSVRLSDMISNDGTVLTDASALKTIDLQLGSTPEQTLTNHIDYDFVIFTVGGPFFDE
jgi:hypothetical protein